jgi:hypothetical protein
VVGNGTRVDRDDWTELGHKRAAKRSNSAGRTARNATAVVQRKIVAVALEHLEWRHVHLPRAPPGGKLEPDQMAGCLGARVPGCSHLHRTGRYAALSSLSSGPNSGDACSMSAAAGSLQHECSSRQQAACSSTPKWCWSGPAVWCR